MQMKLWPLASRICTRSILRNGGASLGNAFDFHCLLALLSAPSSSAPNALAVDRGGREGLSEPRQSHLSNGDNNS